jgi:hypothetical protein
MPAMSIAVLSLFPVTAAPFLSGARAERVAFSPLTRFQRNLHQSQSLLRPKPAVVEIDNKTTQW